MKVMKIIGLLTVLFLASASAEQVEKVYDGDTFRLQHVQTQCLSSGKPRKHQRIRLQGIDAPELAQPFGIQSRDYLSGLIGNRDVQLQCTGCSFDRQTCKAFVSGQDIEAEMVRNGWAYDNPKFSHGRYKKEEKTAQKKHLGVWQQTGGGQRPWDFRKER